MSTHYAENAFRLLGIYFFPFLFEFRPLFYGCGRSALFVSGCRRRRRHCRRRHRRIRSLPLASRPAVTSTPPVRPSTPPCGTTARYTCSPVPFIRDRVSNPNRQSDPAFLVSSDKIRFVAAEETSPSVVSSARIEHNRLIVVRRYHVPPPLRTHAGRRQIVGVIHKNSSCLLRDLETSSARRFARVSSTIL